MKAFLWELWAPLAVIAIGVYRFAAGDPVLSVLGLALGLTCLGAGLCSRRRRR